MSVAAGALGPDDGRARMQRWRHLAEHARPVVRRIGPGLEVAYRFDAQVGEELEYLVAAERQCCQFVGWHLIRDGDTLVLRIVADPERPDDIQSFADLFGATPIVADGSAADQGRTS